MKIKYISSTIKKYISFIPFFSNNAYLVLKALTDIAQHKEYINNNQNAENRRSSVDLEGQEPVDRPRQEHHAVQQPGRQGLEEAIDHIPTELLNLTCNGRSAT